MQAWQAVFTLDKSEWILAEPLLSDIFPALTVKPVREGDPHSPEMVCLIFPEEPARDALEKQLEYIFEMCKVDMPDITVEALPDIDWLQHVYEQLTPIDAGRFFVHGKHIKENIPGDKVAIIIEAATAFGTGEHPTTKGCLLMFDKLLVTKTPVSILDMGCGSGILAIAAAKTIPNAKILGVDIDPNSVTVSRSHAVDNLVENRTQFTAGDGFHTGGIAESAPYDLVFANILAQPLIDMSTQLCTVASGDIILSGFTREQKPYVEKAYFAHGCEPVNEVAIDEWMAVWLRKK